MITYELDETTKRNATKLIYTIDDPDSSWDNALVRCEQIHPFANDYPKDVTERILTHCESNSYAENRVHIHL